MKQSYFDFHPRRLVLLGGLLTGMLLMALLVGCTAAPPVQPASTATAPVETGTEQVSPSPVDTPAPTSTPTSAPPTATPTPEVLSPSDIFDRVSPSVAFIDTPAGNGSGFLIQDGYLVTNAHVVWPFATVRVVFPDGTEVTDAPVLQWDLIADLAVIGPLDVDIQPLTPVDGEAFVVGSDVYLIGYPGEVESFPKPTFSSGLISRKREWERGGITYFQTDATIAGGQSGGVLVGDTGEVIGISGLSFADRQFGMVASAADIMPRVETMIAGEDVDGIKRHPLQNNPATSNQQLVTMENMWDIQAFVIWPEQQTHVKLEVNNDRGGNVFFIVRDAARNVMPLDENGSFLATQGDFDARAGMPYFVLAGTTAGPGSAILSANQPLIPYKDRDDGRAIHKGDTYLGSIDCPGDMDYFLIRMDRDEVAHFKVESVMVNPQVALHTEESQYEKPPLALAGDVDSGGGVFGEDAEFSFKAPQKGQYILIIADLGFDNTGGYFLTVDEPDEAAPTPIVPPPTPTATPRPAPVATTTPFDTPIGRMRTYVSPVEPHFSIPYPANMRDYTSNEEYCTPDELACLGYDPVAWVEMYLISLADVGLDFPNLDQKILGELFRANEERNGSRILSAETFTNSRGVPVSLLHIDDDSGFDVWYLLHLAEDHFILVVISMRTEGDQGNADDAMFSAEYLDKMQKKFFGDMNTDSFEDIARFLADNFDIQR